MIENIPVFILLAQKKLSREAKTLGQRQFDNSVIGDGVYPHNATLQKPLRWLNSASIFLITGTGEDTTYKRLNLISYEYLRSYITQPALPELQGEPIYYSDYGFDQWIVAPTPDQSYQVEISWYEAIQPIDEANQQNWITINAPELLIYAVLREAMIFLKDDERIQVFSGEYDRALQAFVQEDAFRTTDAFADRSKD